MTSREMIGVSSVAPSFFKISSRLASPFTRHSLTPILDIGRIQSFLPLTPETLKTEN
jgi:hypothetical protein